MRLRSSLLICSAIAFALVVTTAAQAAIINNGGGPGTLRYGYHTGPGGGIDANTAHIWRLDEPTGTLVDSTTIVGNAVNMTVAPSNAEIDSILKVSGGATQSARTLTNTSSGRISIATSTGTADNMTAAQYNSFYGATGAHTLDFIVRPDFGPGSVPNVGSGGMRVITQEGNDAGEPNLYTLQWNDTNDGANTLLFTMSPGGVKFTIPTTGPNAHTAAGEWFHVAFVYDGNEGVAANNVKFYWTKIDGPDTALALSTTEAFLAGTGTFGQATDPALVLADPGPELSFFNRPSGSRSFRGALDEIRISNVARGADEFIFVPEPGSLLLAGIGMAGAAGCWYRRKRTAK